MKSNSRILVSIAVMAALAACSATPERIESLETARTIVPQLESSARAGVAAKNISNARKSLDSANRLADSGAKVTDIEFEARNALTSAQIANEKILTAQAQEQVESGNVKRQAVLLEARGREVQNSAQRASDASDRADASSLRADSLEEELADLKAKRTERGLVLTLGDVLFDTGQATLRAGAYGTLDRLAGALKDKPGRRVVIEGHTDNVGSDASNQALSERRAQAVQMALMQRGVATDQMAAVGKGESTPLATNDAEGGRQQNRRVELIFSEEQPRIAADGA
jgi:outer membrane protein OmpA-like peptidoglycan-associated protein